MKWIVIVGATVVLSTSSEAIARAQAEAIAAAGGTATLAQEVATCSGEAAPVWSP